MADGVTIAGTAAQINAVLAGLAYTGNLNFNGGDTLTVATSDGTATDTDTIAITVNPVNDAAALVVANATYQEDATPVLLSPSASLTDATKRIAADVPDIAVLDLGLSDGDDIRNVREWSDVPIVVLSARDREVEKIEALDLGADDFVKTLRSQCRRGALEPRKSFPNTDVIRPHGRRSD